MGDIRVPEAVSAVRDENPYPYFRWLRRNAPVWREAKRSGLDVWHVSRYADVFALLSDARLSKRPCLAPGYVAGPAGLNDHLVHADPPDHTRLRGLVNTAFIPRRVAALEPLIVSTAERLLDELPPAGPIDLIGDFAMPLTFTMICTILGVPAEENAVRLQRALATTVSPTATREERRAAEEELRGHLTRLIAHKRADAAAGADDADLLGALAAARDGRDRLSEAELLGTAYLLLLVGHDTTVNLIGNGMLALLTQPDQLDALRAERELMPTAIEELLRYDSPVRDATFRVATAPIDLDGGTIPAGAIVSLLIGSANRDEEHFDDADRLDLRRHPNEHVALGYGRHYCIGSALARMEADIAFNLLLDRFKTIEPAVDAAELSWRPARVMRGLESLPLHCG